MSLCLCTSMCACVDTNGEALLRGWLDSLIQLLKLRGSAVTYTYAPSGQSHEMPFTSVVTTTPHRGSCLACSKASGNTDGDRPLAKQVSAVECTGRNLGIVSVRSPYTDSISLHDNRKVSTHISSFGPLEETDAQYIIYLNQFMVE